MIGLYALLKFAAYSGWCWVGLSLFQPGKERRLRKALLLGAARLLMGLAFGAAIYLLATLVAAVSRSQVAAYLLVYVPVRWVEWAILEAFIHPGARGFNGFFFGAGETSRGWRARGILVSCLADIPVIASVGGLPLGRFMC